MRIVPLAFLLVAACLPELPAESKTDDSEVVITDDSDSPADDSEIIGQECTFYTDGDADGYGNPSSPITGLCDSPPPGVVADNTDCDDANSGVHPAGAEVCDGLDNDCDGVVDGPDPENGVLFYADSDGDGFGDAEVSQDSCAAPSGFVDNALDCDDLNAAIHPSAEEVCDGLDNNCDQSADGPDAIDPFTWYVDADGDQYGDAASTLMACFSPGQGYVANGDDCDDTNNAVNPSVTAFANSPYGNSQWDYNCDTIDEQQYPVPGDCTVDSNGVCNSVQGFYYDQIPECGGSAAFITGCTAECVPTTSTSRRQKCR